MRCDEAQEWITALVDNELSAEERAAIESHMADCADCRGQLERETALKSNLQRASAAAVMPPNLRAEMENQINTASLTKKEPEKSFSSGWFALTRLRPVWAFAIVLLVVAASLVSQWRLRENIGAIALATHEDIIGGKEVLARSNDPAELRKQLALAVNNRFKPTELDLSMAKLQPVAGFIKKIGGREVLVTVYEGDGPTITCYTFLGDKADAPKTAELFRDEEALVDLFIFTQGELSAVMHQVGEVICILIAKLPAGELLDLLHGKARHARLSTLTIRR